MDNYSQGILDQVIKKRDQFLEAHPQHRNFQKEIDRLLDNSGNVKNRMAVLALLMQAKLMQLHQELINLGRLISQVEQGPQEGHGQVSPN